MSLRLLLIKSILLFLLVLAKYTGLAQNRYTISGYITDSLSTESLIGASIYNTAGKNGTSSNQYGFYSITLPEGSVNILFSYIGYTSQKADFHLKQDTIINIKLFPSIEIKEVVVNAKAVEQVQERTQMSSINIPIIQLKSIPSLLGEVDLMKSLQLTPGVQSGNEGTSGIYVRGGGPDQNLILLDGVPVYNVSHLFGFFSIFNASAINNMELMKGGFPARYGGRISSVVDISMKEGNTQQFHGDFSVGLISAKFTLEGPIWKDRTAFIISGRRTYVDFLARPFINMMNNQNDEEKVDIKYYFYDLTAKINHKFSDKDRVYLSAYLGNDDFKLVDEYDSPYRITSSKSISGLNWGNITAALRWNRIFTNKLFSNISATYSKFNLNMSSEFQEIDDTQEHVSIDYSKLKYISGIEDWALKMDFDYMPSPNHYIRFGANGTYHRFSPGATGFNIADINDISTVSIDTILGATKVNAGSLSAYIEDDMRLGSRLKINIGLHWSGFIVRNNFYHNFQPRLAARFLITDNFSIKSAYSRMGQYIHLLTNTGISLPTDLWVPSTNKLKPQTSDQVALGGVYSLNGVYEFSLEGYYKTMNNVLEYKEGSSFLDIDKEWENKILQGTGKSYGVELFAQKKTGVVTGWIGYTLSWTKRQFDELNNGKWFDYKYDRRHDISVVALYRPNKKVELSGTWVFGTGNAITLPLAEYYPKNPFDPNGYGSNSNMIYSDRNSYRMNAYHRLDLSISLIKKKKYGERRWTFGIYNVYSRKNPFFVDLESRDDYSNGYPVTTKKFVQYSIFPIIPSVSYNYKF